MKRELTCIEKIGYYIDQIIAFNMVCGLSLDTAICPSIVKKTLKILINNHPILQSTTIDDRNILYNVILEFLLFLLTKIVNLILPWIYQFYYRNLTFYFPFLHNAQSFLCASKPQVQRFRFPIYLLFLRYS